MRLSLRLLLCGGKREYFHFVDAGGNYLHICADQWEPVAVGNREAADCVDDALCDRLEPQDPHAIPAGDVRV